SNGSSQWLIEKASHQTRRPNMALRRHDFPTIMQRLRPRLWWLLLLLGHQPHDTENGSPLSTSQQHFSPCRHIHGKSKANRYSTVGIRRRTEASSKPHV